MRILVSGASGSLGSQIISRLSNKHQLGAITRKSELPGSKEIGCAVHNLDLINDNISGVLSNYDAFIHCAAFASGHGKKSEFEGNVTMVKNMLPHLEESGIFTLFISSASVFDDMPRDVPQTEPSKRPSSGYSRSKYDVEQLILSSKYENWVGLRPRAVIGKGDKTLIPRIENLIRRKYVIIPGGGKSLLDYTTMKDFLNAVEAAISLGAKGKFYNISNGSPLMFREMLIKYSKLVHGITKSRNIPLLPLRLISSIYPNDRVNHYSIDQITKPMILDISESIEELNWEPTQSFEECLEELL